MSKKTKICIIIIILLAAISAAAILLLQKGKAGGTIAQIIQDGECIQTIDLSQVEEPYEFTVTGDHNAFNTIRVEPGRIAVVEASCPDKICMQTGYISDALMPITCLPNHLIIRIQSAEGSGIDGVSN